MIHREVISRKRVRGLTMILLIVTAILYLSEAIERLKYNANIVYTFKGALILVTIILILREIKSCTVAYRYSVIANKLIINLVNGKEEKTLESIKISDVLYLGERASMPREYQFIKGQKKYLCNRIGKNSYYCIFKNGDKIKKIKFQPSDKFICRIIKHGELKCNLPSNKGFIAEV